MCTPALWHFFPPVLLYLFAFIQQSGVVCKGLACVYHQPLPSDRLKWSIHLNAPYDTCLNSVPCSSCICCWLFLLFCNRQVLVLLIQAIYLTSSISDIQSYGFTLPSSLFDHSLVQAVTHFMSTVLWPQFHSVCATLLPVFFSIQTLVSDLIILILLILLTIKLNYSVASAHIGSSVSMSLLAINATIIPQVCSFSTNLGVWSEMVLLN